MKNFMNSVKMDKPGRNAFDLTHTLLQSSKMGDLNITLAMEVLPGEKFNIGCEMLLRFAPMVAPVMHKVNATTHYFFVPNRLLWDNWESFITHKATPPGEPPTHPYFIFDSEAGDYNRILDQMGVPKPIAGQTGDEAINALPFQAYQLIWKEYYADQTVQALEIEQVLPTLDDGDNTAWIGKLTTPRKRSWPRDLFTSCLPTPQHGVPIEVPIRFEDAPVRRNASPEGTNWSWTPDVSGSGTGTVVNELAEVGGDVPANNLFIDGDEIDSNTLVEDIRRASALQRFFEKLMRGGRRYTEVIMSFFGVKAQDSRLQRPEYITGVRTPVVISEVLNTTGTAELPQGNMSGHGISMQQGGYGSYTSSEHGWIIGITSIIPETVYQNGMPRALSHKTEGYLDYFWPEFANLGEQEVKSKELFAFDGPTATTTFGYLPRYYWYRSIPSRVTGDFRTTLDFWHLGRQFTAPPTLEPAFLECDPDTRIFAVEEGDYLWCHIQHNIMAVRPIPKYGTPALI